MAHLQRKAVGNLERVFHAAPFALEDGVSHFIEGVRPAQVTQVHESHRCPETKDGLRPFCIYDFGHTHKNRNHRSVYGQNSIGGSTK